MWGYLRASGCGNGLAGSAFGNKRVQGWNFVGLFADVSLRKSDGWVGVWVFFCVRLDFAWAMCGRVIRNLGGEEREMSLSR